MSGERYLWAAVLLRATEDACRPISGKYPHDNDLHTHKSREYLTNKTRDLDEVCNLAGLNPVCVIEKAERWKAMGWASPLEHEKHEVLSEKREVDGRIRKDESEENVKWRIASNVLDSLKRRSVTRQKKIIIIRARESALSSKYLLGVGGWRDGEV